MMNTKQFLATVLTILICAVSNSAEAQTEINSHPNCYNRISLSYRNVYFGSEYGGAGYNGGSFDYIHGFGLSSKIPLYIQTGASLAFTTKDLGSGSYGGYATLDIPIGCAYRFVIPKTDLILLPSLGLDFKGNIIGTDDVATDTQRWFDKYNYKRFQLGWYLSVGMSYKKLYFGLGYGTDFIQIAKKVTTGTFQLSVGINI